MSDLWLRHAKSRPGHRSHCPGLYHFAGLCGLAIDVAGILCARPAAPRRRCRWAGRGRAVSLERHPGKITNAATQLILSHGFLSGGNDSPSIAATAVTNISVLTCANSSDPAFHCDTLPKRKLVKVAATANVPMIFMQLLGIPTVAISADSMSEAAAVDAVLVLDASEAQAYDAPSGYAYTGDATKGCIPGPNGVGDVKNVNPCIYACNNATAADGTHGDCHPFKEVKAAAKNFIDKMYQDYDRIGVVSFNRNAIDVHPLDVNLAQAKTDIDNMEIPDNGGVPCPFLGELDALGNTIPGDELWKCATSNLGGGLLRGSQQFAVGKRPGALWTMIVLGSGGADSTDRQPSDDPDTAAWGFCPPGMTQTTRRRSCRHRRFADTPSKSDPAPLCRSRQFSTAFWPSHQPITATGMVTVEYPIAFDAKDYAVMWGSYIGSPANPDDTGGWVC